MRIPRPGANRGVRPMAVPTAPLPEGIGSDEVLAPSATGWVVERHLPEGAGMPGTGVRHEPTTVRPIGTSNPLAVAIARADLWPAAAIAFLLRGGVVLLLLPIVVIPSTVGIATFVGPTSVTPGGLAPGLLRLAAAGSAILATWVVLGGLVGAAAEALLVREMANGSRRRPLTLGLAAQIWLARATTALPVVFALGWGLPRLAAAGYVELTRPSDTAVALPIRVVAAAPETLVVSALAWLVASGLGAIAVRRIVLVGEPTFEAVWRAVVVLVRSPLPTGRTLVAGAVGSLLVLAPALALVRVLWLATADALTAGTVPLAAVLSLAFVGAWVLALGGAALAAASHGAAWSALAVPGSLPVPGVVVEPVPSASAPVVLGGGLPATGGVLAGPMMATLAATLEGEPTEP